MKCSNNYRRLKHNIQTRHYTHMNMHNAICRQRIRRASWTLRQSWPFTNYSTDYECIIFYILDSGLFNRY